MSSCLRKGSRPYAVICPHSGKIYVQGKEPRCCGLGTPGRKLICKYFACDKCNQAFLTCQELKKHKAKSHIYKPSCKYC